MKPVSSGYKCQKETLDHVLKYPNKKAKEARKAALAAFRKEGNNKKIPQKVIDKIHHLLTHYMQGAGRRYSNIQKICL